MNRHLLLGLIVATLFSFGGKQLLAIKLAALSSYPETGISSGAGSHHNGSRTLMRQINVQVPEVSNKNGKAHSDDFVCLKYKTNQLSVRSASLNLFACFVLEDTLSSSPFILRI